MRSTGLHVIFITVAAVCLLSGCAMLYEPPRETLGISTRTVEKYRKDAAVKVFSCSYKACYEKTEKALESMPKVSIYVKNKRMIALYHIDPNTTPVGIFFDEIDAGRTRLEVSSPSTASKEYIAEGVFSEIAQP